MLFDTSVVWHHSAVMNDALLSVAEGVKMETVYGEKYAATKDLSRVEIAKLIRADIKAAVASGALPAAKYRVWTESYSGGSSIDVEIGAFWIANLFNPERLEREANNLGVCGHDRYSAAAMRVIGAVRSIVAAYNYDGSDIASDYFHVRFYSSVDFDGGWETARREMETEAIVGQKPEPVPAQIGWLESMGVAS